MSGASARRADAPAAAGDWYLLIHQLPPRPLYLRAKVRNRLARVGAVALKNSVYVLPRRDECLEDLQWIAQEAAAGGGEAFVCAARFVGGVSDAALTRRFRAAAGAAYAALKGDAAKALGRARSRPGEAEQAPAELLRLRERLAEIAALDFFEAPGREEVEAMLRALDVRLHGKARAGAGRDGRAAAELMGRVWVTRKDPRVDRLASAWLVRRFVDPGARFRFVDATRESPGGDEIGFDMPGARFTHEGERCTFETLLARLGIEDPGARAVGEIVHDLDLKDGRFARPEAEGVRQLVAGLARTTPDDAERVERGLLLFDALHAALRGAAASRPATGPGRAKRRRPAQNRAASRTRR
jgi:hypothetical protein